MQTAKAASTVARIAEHIIALWHSKVFTFWSHRVEKRLIDGNIENKILMRLCCNGVVLLRLTRRGRVGVRKIPQKSPKSPLPLIETTFKISHKICEAGCARARQTNFGPPPPPVRSVGNRECLFDRRAMRRPGEARAPLFVAGGVKSV
jgi:hypothetical protein